MLDLWFTEEDIGQLRYGYRIEKVLYRDQSEFQKIDVLETTAYGRMLLLDGLVMLTEADEFVYHELIAHIPTCLHPKPKKVVVIGGGDGGTVRELIKHPDIEEITLCEIDGKVVEASKEFFPAVSSGFRDPRVHVRIGDGVAYLRDEVKPGSLDLILIDSTDPIGPGEGLFTKDFYKSVASGLAGDGIMAAQSESPWYEKEALCKISNNIAAGFDHQRFYVAPVPTYPRGLWSWVVAGKNPIDPHDFDRQRLASVGKGLKFLNEDTFTAVFALPNFFKEKLDN